LIGSPSIEASTPTCPAPRWSKIEIRNGESPKRPSARFVIYAQSFCSRLRVRAGLD
jgi:hypothetical protein